MAVPRDRMQSSVLHPNGEALSAEQCDLPAGRRYIIEDLNDAPELSDGEEQGLLDAMASIRRGCGVEHQDVHHRIRDALSR